MARRWHAARTRRHDRRIPHPGAHGALRRDRREALARRRAPRKRFLFRPRPRRLPLYRRRHRLPVHRQGDRLAARLRFAGAISHHRRQGAPRTRRKGRLVLPFVDVLLRHRRQSIVPNAPVYVILATGKCTTSSNASAGTIVALPNVVFTGETETIGTTIRAEIYVK